MMLAIDQVCELKNNSSKSKESNEVYDTFKKFDNFEIPQEVLDKMPGLKNATRP